MTDSVLAQAFVYLCAAVVFVPLARRLGLGAVLGYLIAGIAIGPFVLGLVGKEGHRVMHFAEFGVVIMLFLVGLELRPALLWQLRRPIVGLGGLQVVLTTAAIAGGALALDVAWRPALAIGMVAAMSSTAIVLATLGERGLIKTSGGQASFSVLLFQDIAVIPILAVFPLLADPALAGGAVDDGAGRPAWQSALLLLSALAGVLVAGRYVVRPMFRFLAQARLRESFTAAALMLVVGVALLMQQVDLSPALGTFLAGVLLAESEYRHELESDVEPFKGLFLGLFFITVGAQLDLGLIGDRPLAIGGLVAGVMVIKLAVLHTLGRAFRLDRPGRWLMAVGLTQIGEFAFVLLQYGSSNRVFDAETVRLLTPVVACSMVLTPLLFVALERWILPAVTEDTADRPDDEIPAGDSQVVIAGFGRFGQVVGRLLRANGVSLTILDHDAEMVETIGKVGIKVYYGDATRAELLRAAGCAKAKLFVLAIDDPEKATECARTVQRHFPQLTILARARNRAHYFELKALGIELVHREQFAASYELGIDALRALGMRAYTAQRKAQLWRTHEKRVLDDLAGDWAGDRVRYFARQKAALADVENLLRAEDPGRLRDDGAWDTAPRRDDTSTDTETGSG